MCLPRKKIAGLESSGISDMVSGMTASFLLQNTSYFQQDNSLISFVSVPLGPDSMSEHKGKSLACFSELWICFLLSKYSLYYGANVLGMWYVLLEMVGGFIFV